MSSFESAASKLETRFPLTDLPLDRDSPVWDRIEKTYDLTLPELSALRNYVHSGANSRSAKVEKSGG